MLFSHLFSGKKQKWKRNDRKGGWDIQVRYIKDLDFILRVMEWIKGLQQGRDMLRFVI